MSRNVFVVFLAFSASLISSLASADDLDPAATRTYTMENGKPVILCAEAGTNWRVVRWLARDDGQCYVVDKPVN